MKYANYFFFFLISLFSSTVWGQEEDESTNANAYIPSYSEEAYGELNDSIYELPYQETGPHFTGQILYWKTMEPNLIFGVDQPATADDLILKGHVKDVSYRWDPGVRVGGGFLFSIETIDANVEYTYFHNEGGRSTNLREGRILKGTFVDDLGDLINNMSTKTDLQYHTLDLYLTHAIHKTNSFFTKFLFGGRGAWISEGWNTWYKTDVIVNPQAFPTFALKTLVQNKWKFSGGGLRTGLIFNWSLGWGLNLNFQGNFSAILGRMRNKYQIDKTSKVRLAKTRPSSTRVVPNYQLLLGVGWRKSLANGAFKTSLNWEINGWSRLHETWNYPLVSPSSSHLGTRERSSIVIQGLTLGIDVEF